MWGWFSKKLSEKLLCLYLARSVVTSENEHGSWVVRLAFPTTISLSIIYSISLPLLSS